MCPKEAAGPFEKQVIAPNPIFFWSTGHVLQGKRQKTDWGVSLPFQVWGYIFWVI